MLVIILNKIFNLKKKVKQVYKKVETNNKNPNTIQGFGLLHHQSLDYSSLSGPLLLPLKQNKKDNQKA